MEISRLKKLLTPILKNDAPQVGELCIIWIAGVVAYAIVREIEPFYMEGWWEFRFLILRQIPPQEHEWRIKTEHLHGHEFQLDSHPAAILALNLGAVALSFDDPNMVKSKSWKEMIDGDDGKEDDPGGNGCPGKCDTPCS